MKHFLLVEDEKILAKNIAFFLEREGYKVDIEYDGEAGLIAYNTHAYDLILLDWTLPKKDGLEVCKTIRKESNIPIIMITAKGEIYDKIIGLELGADDYIVKPFDQREMLARIHALLRRNENGNNEKSNDQWLEYEGLKLDREKLLILYNHQNIELTANEYKLMEILMKKPQNVYSREFLYEEVWGGLLGYNERTVDVTISRLRKKLMELSGKKFFHAVRGLGYRLGGN
ncbi:two-component system response regulator VicR/two-component system response regulator ArlR [Natranaerovirga pectinivora]|uniref:Stage 0 sporulation protein A homolog n=1 Tax=Natranaerovirga pectinivora TaxID=682400 RepID=A0A4R3MST0_9FIRM|nr:response regulator transcription factor [Natranaerovirga pectinivora]TCT16084.1 two-component system response regulator VicR/two-component system response regulator ArlR [Natranaerovirga pectinivora]